MARHRVKGRDNNHAKIVKDLKNAGCSVFDLRKSAAACRIFWSAMRQKTIYLKLKILLLVTALLIAKASFSVRGEGKRQLLKLQTRLLTWLTGRPKEVDGKKKPDYLDWHRAYASTCKKGVSVRLDEL